MTHLPLRKGLGQAKGAGSGHLQMETDPFPCQELPWTGESVGHQVVRQDYRLRSLSPRFPLHSSNKVSEVFFSQRCAKDVLLPASVGVKCLNPSQVLCLSFNSGVGTAKPVSCHDGCYLSTSNLTLSTAFRSFSSSEMQRGAMPKHPSKSGPAHMFKYQHKANRSGSCQEPGMQWLGPSSRRRYI